MNKNVCLKIQQYKSHTNAIGYNLHVLSLRVVLTSNDQHSLRQLNLANSMFKTSSSEAGVTSSVLKVSYLQIAEFSCKKYPKTTWQQSTLKMMRRGEGVTVQQLNKAYS